MASPLEILRQRNAAKGKPAKLTGAQKGGIAGGSIVAGILAAIYVAEGGYVNDPADRGGPTNYGITEAVARQNGYMGDMRRFPKHCYGDITVCSDKIYVDQYISKPGFTPMLTLEPAVAKELIDTGVNMGPAKSAVFFQASLNVLCKAKLTVDGNVGPQTINAYANCQREVGPVKLCVTMLNALDGAQKRRYDGIVARDPSQKRFYRGWINHRIGNVKRSECQRSAA